MEGNLNENLVTKKNTEWEGLVKQYKLPKM